MPQTSILSFVKVRKRKKTTVYLFLMDIPKILGPEGMYYGSFRKGDLVPEAALPNELWNVLMRRGAVRPYFMEL